MSELSQLLSKAMSQDTEWEHWAASFGVSTSESASSSSPSSASTQSSSTASSHNSQRSTLSPPPAEFARFLNSSQFSDLTLKYDGKESRVHKILLCTQSNWFAKACEGNFAEAEQPTITLFDDDAEAVDMMLQYCYGGSGLPSTDLSGAQRCTSLISIYSIADKYDVPGLRDRAADEFGKELKRQWEELWTSGDLTYVLISIYACAPVPSSCRLCQDAVDLLDSHIETMQQQDPEKLQSLLDENPELVADLMAKQTRAQTTAPTVKSHPWDSSNRSTTGLCGIGEGMTPIDDQGGFVLLAASCGIRVI